LAFNSLVSFSIAKSSFAPDWLSAHLPNAVLLTYPDSGHGSLFQFHESFTRQAAAFLTSESIFAPY
jgi:pimeloyl-ACP methyl ester carboxylesterase